LSSSPSARRSGTEIDYLRLCFRFGGFPGYDRIDRGMPWEIEILRKDLLAF